MALARIHEMRELPSVILLVGPPMSGKTTASKYLETIGYYTISASDVIAGLDNMPLQSWARKKLIERGEQMLRESGPEWFAHRLLSLAEPHKKVVFEGVRPLETVRRIKSAISDSVVVYIDTDEHLRKVRYQLVGDPDILPYDTLLQTAAERSAAGAENISRHVKNNGTIDELHQRLLDVLLERR